MERADRRLDRNTRARPDITQAGRAYGWPGWPEVAEPRSLATTITFDVVPLLVLASRRPQNWLHCSFIKWGEFVLLGAPIEPVGGDFGEIIPLV